MGGRRTLRGKKKKMKRRGAHRLSRGFPSDSRIDTHSYVYIRFCTEKVVWHVWRTGSRAWSFLSVRSFVKFFFFSRSQINGRRYLDYSPDKTPFVQTRIRYDRNFASRSVEEAGKRVRSADAGAGISYVSGYNSEIPKSMDIYCRSDQTKKNEGGKKEREEVIERVTKYLGRDTVVVCV